MCVNARQKSTHLLQIIKAPMNANRPDHTQNVNPSHKLDAILLGPKTNYRGLLRKKYNRSALSSPPPPNQTQQTHPLPDSSINGSDHGGRCVEPSTVHSDQRPPRKPAHPPDAPPAPITPTRTHIRPPKLPHFSRFFADGAGEGMPDTVVPDSTDSPAPSQFKTRHGCENIRVCES